MSSPCPPKCVLDEQTMMELEAVAQHGELLCEWTNAKAYREYMQRQRTMDAKRRAAVEEELHRRINVAESILPGVDSIQEASEMIMGAVVLEEGSLRLGKMAMQLAQYGKEVSAQEDAEMEQAMLELRLYNSTVPCPVMPTAVRMSAAEQAAVRELLAACERKTEEKSAEQMRQDVQEAMGRASSVLPIILAEAERNPEIINEQIVSVLNEMLPSHPDMVTASQSDSQTGGDASDSGNSSDSLDAHLTAGDWARHVVQTEGLGLDTLTALARGLTRVVDARDDGDWMSLMWEVAVCAPASALMRHDVNYPLERVVAELDRATEIFALSYRHRVHLVLMPCMHGDQAHGLRYRLPECCWAELREVVKAAVIGRPHGRVVLWWDQVLGATAGVGAAWATAGLFPFATFRVVYNPPARCRNHAPVFCGQADFESVTDDHPTYIDIRRLWINLEHRLALRGCGLVMNPRANVQAYLRWGLGWEGQEYREISGEENMPMLCMRKTVAHLLREQISQRDVTFLQDVPQVQRWGATLAALPQRDWAPFLAGRCNTQKYALTVPEVIRVVLRAGAHCTLDGAGYRQPSAPTVACAQVSQRGWSGVTEWAPLLTEPALQGWLITDVEREARRELARFTVWICYPVVTHAGERVAEAVAIGKLWTPVQAVSSYMLVWLRLATGLDDYREREMSADEFSDVYANARVRKTQLVWPSKVRAFHEVFAGAHWALSCMGSSGAHKAKDYPSGLFSIWDGCEPVANRALRCARLPANILFECLVEEWGPVISRNLAANPTGYELHADNPPLRIAAGVPFAVMSGEQVTWQGECGRG